MLHGNILTSDGWVNGTLSIEAGRIGPIRGVHCNPDDNQDPFVLPGFIDLHVHGGGGADVMEGAAAISTMTRMHARHGTTSLLATTMTAPPENLAKVLADLAHAAPGRSGSGQDDAARPDAARPDAARPDAARFDSAQPYATRADGARILGVHLEGPYIAPGRLGAQPPVTAPAVWEELRGYLDLAPIKVVTLAPEIAGHLEIIEKLSARGVRVQLGHTDATYDETVLALRHGASGFTHLFNAMSGLHHRNPGVVGAALAHAEYAELIPDLLHVHPGAIRAALRSIPRLYMVTDSTAAAGMGDGDYHLGSQRVTHCLGAVRLADGTLAGSALTMDQAFRNLVTLGLPIADISDRLSRFPADYLDLDLRGRIQTGAWADCVVFDRNLTLRETWVEGALVTT